MRDMTKRPKALVGESVIVSFLLLLAQPYPPQGIARVFRRDAQPIMPVYHFFVRITAAMCDPCAVAGGEDRLQSSDQSAGRNRHFVRLSIALADIGFAIRHHKQAAAVEARFGPPPH